MSHVGPDKMTGGKGAAQAGFAGKDASSHNSSEFPGIIAGIRRVGPSDAE